MADVHRVLLQGGLFMYPADRMETQPKALHQRMPVYLGAAPFVELAERFLAEEAEI